MDNGSMIDWSFTLNAIMRECYQTAKDHGWHDGEERPLPEAIALMHSELSEALEEHRKGKPVTKVYFTKPPKPPWWRFEARRKWKEMAAKPEGIASEYADTIIRIFDDAYAREIPLVTALFLKMNYNKSREYRHGGKVC